MVEKADAPATVPTFTGMITLTLQITVVSDPTRMSRATPVRCVLNANVANNPGGDAIAEVHAKAARL